MLSSAALRAAHPASLSPQTVGRGNGEQALARWQNVVGGKTVEEAFEEVFKFLQSQWGSIEPSGDHRLPSTRDVKCIHG